MPGPGSDKGRRSANADAVLTAFLDLDDLLRRALAYASESAGAEGSRILLHDAEAHEFVVAAASGPSDDQIRGRRFSETNGLPGVVFKSGQAHIATSQSVPALMTAPLQIGDRTIGIIETMNRIGGGQFAAADLERFVSCCGLIAVALENASLYRRLDKEAEIIKRSRDDQAQPLIAESATMRRALAQAERAAGGRSTILLIGETGTGKEQVARHIHETSPRASGSFVAINCGALPEGLLESELFGHERGAFTGAASTRIGKFEQADTGTLLLDEIGEMKPALQAKLLHVLQDGEFTKLGSNKRIQVDVRVVAATNRDLEKMMQSGDFREDLYYRLKVIELAVPPLRERRDEIPTLIDFFIARYARKYNRPARELTEPLRQLFMHYEWPGNIRELENMIKRVVILQDEQLVICEIERNMQRAMAAAVASAGAMAVAVGMPMGVPVGVGGLMPSLPYAPPPISSPAAPAEVDSAISDEAGPAQAGGGSLATVAKAAAMRAERAAIEQTLRQVHWNRRKAAQILGVSYKTLLNKIKECGISRV